MTTTEYEQLQNKKVKHGLFGKDRKLRRLFVRFISWPVLENVNYNGLCYAGVAHLNKGRPENFCKALILNDQL